MAESLPVTNDFLVSPANKELLVVPGESASFDLRITNRTGVRARFLMGTEDLNAKSYSDEFSDDSASAPALTSLTPYIKSTKSEVYLEHGESVELPIAVSLPSYINEPSLYGLLTVTAGTDKDVVESATGARVLSRIGVPILVRTNDERVGSGSLLNFGTADGSRYFAGAEVPLKISYENEGDVHLRPSGQITLRNFFGAVAGKIAVEPWYILPGTTRSRVVTVQTGQHFGYYTATLVMTSGDAANVSSATTGFWIFPKGVILVLVIAIGVLIFMVRGIRRLRRARQEIP